LLVPNVGWRIVSRARTMDHVELTRGCAETLFDTYVDWYEDFESGFLEGIYENAPDADERIAYEFATGVRGESDSETVKLPWHAAVAIEAGASAHLEEEADDADIREAVAILTGLIEEYEAGNAPAT